MPTVDGRRARGEGILAWLRRRSDDPTHIAAHARIERWLADYPAKSRPELVSRLSDRNDRNFAGAFFELYAHRLLRAMPDCTVDVQAPIPGGSCPDFAVRSENIPTTYIDTTAFEDEELDRSGTDEVVHLFREATPHIRVPGFAVMIGKVERGPSNPSPKRLAAALDRWFRNFDHASLVASLGPQPAHHTLPNTVIEDVEWRFAVSLIPLRSAEMRPSTVAASAGGSEVVYVRTAERVRDAISTKLRQHPDVPLIVAICGNSWSENPSEYEVSEVLLGTSYCTVPRSGMAEAVHQRRRDGLWVADGTARSRLVGLVVTSLCMPWTVPNNDLCLWVNPHAGSAVLPRWPFRRHGWNLSDGSSTEVPGQRPTAVLH